MVIWPFMIWTNLLAHHSPPSLLLSLPPTGQTGPAHIIPCRPGLFVVLAVPSAYTALPSALGMAELSCSLVLAQKLPSQRGLP